MASRLMNLFPYLAQKCPFLEYSWGLEENNQQVPPKYSFPITSFLHIILAHFKWTIFTLSMRIKIKLTIKFTINILNYLFFNIKESSVYIFFAEFWQSRRRCFDGPSFPIFRLWHAISSHTFPLLLFSTSLQCVRSPPISPQ